MTDPYPQPGSHERPAHSLEARLLAAWPAGQWQSAGVVLAVSGGADSVALAAAMACLRLPGGGDILAAHFHHGLRGGQADDDEAFVRQLCQRLGLRLAVGRGDVRRGSIETGEGIEAAARQMRYDFLLAAAHAHGARYIATAHTADDQAETILHHILRGTGLAGLAGLPLARPLSEGVTLIRPLLRVRRNEVLGYLSQRGLSYREDASNRDLRFTRNRIRHELLPQLAAQYNPAIVEALLRLGQLAGESREIVEGLVAELCARAVRFAGPRAEVACERLAGQPRHLVRELFIRIWRTQSWPQQAMGFVEWESLAEMAAGDRSAAPRDLPGGVRAQLQGPQLVLTGSSKEG